MVIFTFGLTTLDFELLPHSFFSTQNISVTFVARAHS